MVLQFILIHITLLRWFGIFIVLYYGIIHTCIHIHTYKLWFLCIIEFCILIIYTHTHTHTKTTLQRNFQLMWVRKQKKRMLVDAYVCMRPFMFMWAYQANSVVDRAMLWPTNYNLSSMTFVFIACFWLVVVPHLQRVSCYFCSTSKSCGTFVHYMPLYFKSLCVRWFVVS